MSGQDRPGRLTEAQRQAIAQAGRSPAAQQAAQAAQAQGLVTGPSMSEERSGQLPYQQTPGAIMPPMASNAGQHEQSVAQPEAAQADAPAQNQGGTAAAQQPEPQAEQQNIIQQKAEENAERAKAQEEERAKAQEQGPEHEH